MKKISRLLFYIAFTSILFSSVALASGPFYVYPEKEGGYPYSWKDGVINWKYDEGGLSDSVPALPVEGKETLCATHKNDVGFLCKENISQCGAVKCIEALFSRWQESTLKLADGKSVKASNIKIFNKGSVGEDIDKDNFSLKKGFLKDLEENTVVFVFDSDGEILKAAALESKNDSFDPASSSAPLGLTELKRDKNAPYYTGGWLLLNGLLSGHQDFAATILHEIGHLLGLDHSQPQQDVFGSSINVVKSGMEQGVTTMYPNLVVSEQVDLHIDDIAGLASLYPTADFQKMCIVEGDLVNKEGDPYQGINVIAYEEGSNDIIDARSFVSGALWAPCTENGHYFLAGLAPGVPYRIVYEPIFPEFRNFQQGLNPYPHDEDKCKLVPGLADKGIVVAGDGSELIACPDEKGGVALSYSISDTTGVYVSPGNRISMSETKLNSKAQKEDSSSDKKGWCMSVGAPVNPAWILTLPALVAFLAVTRRRLK